MATINFPSSPTLNQVYTFGTESWQWNATGWAKVVASGLPTQTGNSGKYLTTDGTTATWAAVPSDSMTAALHGFM